MALWQSIANRLAGLDQGAASLRALCPPPLTIHARSGLLAHVRAGQGADNAGGSA
jgi:hypothetical protein